MKSCQIILILSTLTLIFSFSAYGSSVYGCVSRFSCTGLQQGPYIDDPSGGLEAGDYGSSVSPSMSLSSMLSGVKLYSVNQSEVVVTVPEVIKGDILHGSSAEREEIGIKVGELLDSIGFQSSSVGFELVVGTKVPVFDAYDFFLSEPIGPKGQAQTWRQWLGQWFYTYGRSQGSIYGGGGDSNPGISGGGRYYGGGGYSPWADVPVFNPDSSIPYVTICGPDAGSAHGNGCPGI